MRAFASAMLALSFVLPVFAEDVPLQNWPVPQSSSRAKVASNADVSEAAVFVAVTPCRIADTRNPNGPYGGPAFGSNSIRNFFIPGSSCTGIPTAAAYSLNFTVLGYSNSSGWITAYPTGSPLPFVSTVNFGSGPAVANSAIVPAGSGSITVYAAGVTHVIIDINGYYADSGTDLNFDTHLGVFTNQPFGPAIFGANTTEDAGTFTSGVLGELVSETLDEGSGVMGYTPGGVTWGVKGVTDSLSGQSGGVLGLAFATVTDLYDFAPVGVRGDSDVGDGITGFTSSSDGAAGVAGSYVDLSGNIINFGILGTVDYGVFAGGDMGGTGAKYFVDPHPTDAAKVIRYVALEGPEAGTYFRGRARFVNGQATIEVPESFRMVTEAEGLTVHVTPVGGFAQIAVMQESLDGIVVQATNDVEFTYIVHGVRRGYENFDPIVPGIEFRPQHGSATMPSHLNEAQKRRLIENGTYNEDGTVNTGTATRLGWEQEWESRREKQQQRAPREKRQ